METKQNQKLSFNNIGLKVVVDSIYLVSEAQQKSTQALNADKNYNLSMDRDSGFMKGWWYHKVYPKFWFCLGSKGA